MTPALGLVCLVLLTGVLALPTGERRVAADVFVGLVSLAVAGVLLVSGRRTCASRRGWTLVAGGLLLGVTVSAVADVLGGADAPVDPARTAASVPAHLIAAVGVLSLLGWSRLRAGGARLLTESALFCTSSFVLAQVLVVGPLVRDAGLSLASRVALEASCLAATVLLGAGLTLLTATWGARRTTGAVTLAGLTGVTVADALAALGSTTPFGVPGLLTRAVFVVGLVLLALAAVGDPGSTGTDGRGDRLTAGLTLAGHLLPHLVMTVAAVLLLGSALLVGTPTPAALVAVALGLLLTAVHRGVSARDEVRVGVRLERSEAWFRSLVRSSSDPVLVLGPDLVVTWAAPALEGPALEAGRPLVGVPVTESVHPQDADAVRAWLEAPAVEEGTLSGLRSFRLPAADGTWRVLEAGVTDLRRDLDVRALVLHCRDVTVRSDTEDELRSLAFTDPVTGLPNRAAHLRVLGDELAEAGETPAVALLLFEVEGLNEARENVGRDVVDVSLIEVGRRLRATVRGDDQVARVGPELFAVLAHGVDGEPDLVAARCLSVVEQPITTELGLVDLTAAVGLVPLVAGLSAGVVTDRAELAVLAARAAGPGTVRRYEPALGAARDRRERLRGDLVGARARGELALAWQPIVSLSDQRVTGVEALLRWRHPSFGELEPEEFIPIAERAGLIGDLQRWVLVEATTAAAALPVHGEPLRLGINVSAVHVASGTLVGDVSHALKASGLQPERLVIEITESTVLADGPHVETDFAALRLMGVHVALDDFGSGYSSLAHLTRLPVDIIKLDRTFLARIDKDAQTRALCESVIGIGGALGIDVVAEGVETPSQLAVLRSMGCGFAQGFLLSRPLSLPRFVALVDGTAGMLWPGLVGRV
ncbi:bifunctional diguanylate cyclase/phosphodiesterase [Modestobacter sp. Leaf380]|uniref:putative bifunctional diguanylate cyclase/phosphodiesterase n=1 Tax=Modestobacter sp. Leaf380 TaxID=1736356 RepID=UPI0012F9ABCC|nr:EAL domain-containing protein [Modestobacter sp. Leaf380]